MFDLCHYRLKFLTFSPFKIIRIFCNSAINCLKLELQISFSKRSEAHTYYDLIYSKRTTEGVREFGVNRSNFFAPWIDKNYYPGKPMNALLGFLKISQAYQIWKSYYYQKQSEFVHANAGLAAIVVLGQGMLTVFWPIGHLSGMKADLGKHAALLDPACMAIAGTTASGLVKRTSLAVSDFRLFFLINLRWWSDSCRCPLPLINELGWSFDHALKAVFNLGKWLVIHSTREAFVFL